MIGLQLGEEKTQICISNLHLYEQPLGRTLKAMEGSPYSCWEIMDESPNSLTDERVKRIVALSRSRSLEINVHASFMSVGYSSIDEQTRRQCLETLINTIRHAASLGSRYVVVHPAQRYGVDPEAEFQLFVDGVGRIARAAGEGTSVLVENAVEGTPLFNSTVAGCKAFLTSVPEENVGLCFDVGHANIGEGVQAYAQALFPWIRNIHVHDNGGKRDSHLEVGAGSVDWRLFLGYIKRRGYQHYLTVETKCDPFASASRIVASIDPG